MKQNTKSMLVGGLVGATVMIAGSVFAAHGGPLAQEAKDAVVAGDFQAFQAAVEGTKAENLPEEIFELKVDLYAAKEAEDEDKITAIKAELKEYKSEKRAEHQAVREDRKAAVEAGDYDAFVALVPEGRDIPSEQVFGLIGDLYEAKDAEDKEAVQEIKAELKELGFEKPGRGHKGHKRGDRTDR